MTDQETYAVVIFVLIVIVAIIMFILLLYYSYNPSNTSDSNDDEFEDTNLQTLKDDLLNTAQTVDDNLATRIDNLKHPGLVRKNRTQNKVKKGKVTTSKTSSTVTLMDRLGFNNGVSNPQKQPIGTSSEPGPLDITNNPPICPVQNVVTKIQDRIDGDFYVGGRLTSKTIIADNQQVFGDIILSGESVKDKLLYLSPNFLEVSSDFDLPNDLPNGSYLKITNNSSGTICLPKFKSPGYSVNIFNGTNNNQFVSADLPITGSSFNSTKTSIDPNGFYLFIFAGSKWIFNKLSASSSSSNGRDSNDAFDSSNTHFDRNNDSCSADSRRLIDESNEFEEQFNVFSGQTEPEHIQVRPKPQVPLRRSNAGRFNYVQTNDDLETRRSQLHRTDALRLENLHLDDEETSPFVAEDKSAKSVIKAIVTQHPIEVKAEVPTPTVKPVVTEQTTQVAVVSEPKQIVKTSKPIDVKITPIFDDELESNIRLLNEQLLNYGV